MKIRSIAAWFDSHARAVDDARHSGVQPRRIDWSRQVPFIAIHAGCLLVPWVGVSPGAIAAALALYALRMFAITAFYHRYFSHHAFRTGRAAQFVFAWLGATAAQRGPLWWASHHRHHHVHSDQPQDSHSALHHGFAWSHLGWFMADGNWRTRSELVHNFARFPELRFLDRFDALAPLSLALSLYALGGIQLLVWGFCVSTVLVYHATFSINSLAHRFGTRRFATRDHSRNNFWLALLTFGEGWHNNHHHYPAAARQGFYWWEVDLSFYGLKALAMAGIVWDLKPVPARALQTSKETA